MPGEHVRALARDRRQLEARVEHHVADDVHAVRDRLRLEIANGGLGRAEEERREAVGDDPVQLLRHLPVERTQPRFHVRDGDSQLRRRERAGERRVRIAVDEHAVRLLVEHGALDPREHPRRLLRVRPRAGLEPVGGRREPELVEEDLRELPVVVLAGVQHDLVDACVAQRDGDRPGLDELGAVAHDGEHAHGRKQ